MTIEEKSLMLHKKHRGKLEIISKINLKDRENLSLAYTPGVAAPCKKIHENNKDVYLYTCKSNSVAIITDGTAVLGLGDIGPSAALPVMEGKAILFKEFANIDAYPISLRTTEVDEIVFITKNISTGFGGINLEDIKAPRCFEIEAKLKKELDIPVFHDDQHGTAIVALAGLLNATKLVNKKMSDIKVVINGVGSAGIAITKLLYEIGVRNILLVGRTGILEENDPQNNLYQEEVLKLTNPTKEKGSLKDAMKNSDVFIGVSSGGVVSEDMVSSMAKDSIVFALANPIPEIMPDLAIKAGARIIATGRSDFPNQINNVLAFPGIFRGALDVRSREINDSMKLAAAHAIANIVGEKELREDYIIPDAYNDKVVKEVAKAVAEAAKISGVLI